METGGTDGWEVQVATPLTPERLRTVEFGRAAFGRRGYNESDVHQFLSRLAEDMISSDAEKARLRAEIERLRNYYRASGVDIDARAARPAPSAHAIAVMSRAQQAADAQIAQAEMYSRELVAQARSRCEEILCEAERRAAEAAERAATMYRERRHDATDEEEYLERRVAWLRTFAEVAQIQLKSTLEALGREIDKLAVPPPESVATGRYLISGPPR